MKNLSLKQTITIEGTDTSFDVDFSDRAFVTKLIQLIKKYEGIEDKVNEKMAEIENSGKDELEKLLDLELAQVEILKTFKEDVNTTFGFAIVDKVFGEGCVPSIERYYPFFEELLPYIQQAREQEYKTQKFVAEKYGLKRIK